MTATLFEVGDSIGAPEGLTLSVKSVISGGDRAICEVTQVGSGRLPVRWMVRRVARRVVDDLRGLVLSVRYPALDLVGDFLLYSEALQISDLRWKRNDRRRRGLEDDLLLCRPFAETTVRAELESHRLSSSDRYIICLTAAGAVAELHRRGIYHGALRPSNLVRLEAASDWQFTDFLPSRMNLSGSERRHRSEQQDVVALVDLMARVMGVEASGMLRRVNSADAVELRRPELSALQSLFTLMRVEPKLHISADEIFRSLYEATPEGGRSQSRSGPTSMAAIGEPLSARMIDSGPSSPIGQHWMSCKYHSDIVEVVDNPGYTYLRYELTRPERYRVWLEGYAQGALRRAQRKEWYIENLNAERVDGPQLLQWLSYGIDETLRSRLVARHEWTLPYISDAELASLGDDSITSPDDLLRSEIEQWAKLRERVLSGGFVRTSLDDSGALVESFAGSIISVVDHEALVMPSFQFDDDGAPRQIVRRVNALLGVEGPSWWLADWWTRERGDDRRAPASMVDDQQTHARLLEIAVRTVRGSGLS